MKKYFLETYFENTPTEEQKAHFFLMKQVIHCLYAFKYFRRVANELETTPVLEFSSLQEYKDFILDYFTGCSKICNVHDFNTFAHIFLREAVKNIRSEEYKKSLEVLKSHKKETKKFSAALENKLNNAFEKLSNLYKGTSEKGRPLVPSYIPEFVDPLHRRGRLMEPFFTSWKDSTSTDNYELWLHKLDLGLDVPGKEDLQEKGLLDSSGKPHSILSIKYLNEKQRIPYEVEVDDKGRMLTKQNNGIFHSEDAKKENAYIFVIGLDKKIYIGRFQRGTFGHPSFLSGKPVLAAGYFVFENGKLVAISDDSGHYNGFNGKSTPLPTKEMMVDTVQILLSKGVDVSKTEILFTGKENDQKILAEDLIQ